MARFEMKNHGNVIDLSHRSMKAARSDMNATLSRLHAADYVTVSICPNKYILVCKNHLHARPAGADFCAVMQVVKQ